MWFTRVSIANPVMAVMVMLAFVVLGLFSYQRLSIDQFPNIDIPVVVVQVDYPGASPDIVESEVTKKIEEAVNTVAGIGSLFSRSYEGSSVTIVEFNLGVDGRKAAEDVREKVALVRPLLREEVKEPRISRFDPQSQPVFNVAVLATDASVSPQQLTTWATQSLQKRLENVRGVGAVSVIGGVAREISIRLKPDAMEALGVSVEQVAAALRSENQEQPLGSIRSREQERVVQINARMGTPRDFRDIVVARKTGVAGSGTTPVAVKLWQVADVVDGPQEVESLALYNGQRTVLLSVQKSQGENTIAVVDGLNAALKDAQILVPKGMKTEVNRDNSRSIRLSVANVKRTMIEGAALTILIVFLFLNSWRSTVITGLTLPIALIGTFLFMYIFGFTINVITLMALSLCVGLLIDDAIVVRENIVRHAQMGLSPREAALKGTEEIGLAVLATTLSIVAVFLPIGFMGGIVGQFFHEFGLTIVAAVLISMFVSFTLDPMLSSVWHDPQSAHHHGDPKAVRGWYDNTIGRVTGQFDRFTEWLSRQYQRILAWSLGHRKSTLAIALASFVVAILLTGSLGKEFVPKADFSETQINFYTPVGSALEVTESRAKQIDAALREFPEVVYTVTTINSGNAQGKIFGSTYVRLVDRKQRERGIEQLSRPIRERLARIAGITVTNIGVVDLGGNKSIGFSLQGPDLVELEKLGRGLQKRFEQIPGLVDLDSTLKPEKPTVAIDIRRDAAADLGLNVSAVASTLRVLLAGQTLGTWRAADGQNYDVKLRLAPDYRDSTSDLGQLPLIFNTNEGVRSVKLAQVAQVRPATGPNQINRRDLNREINFDANALGRSPGVVADDVRAILQSTPFPPGYRYVFGGSTKNMQESFSYAVGALALAVVFIYMILASQFKSFLQPLALMSSLPLTLIGVVLALLAFRSTLNMFSIIGIVMLMGLVTKNAILLVDFAIRSREGELLPNGSRSPGMPREQALLHAAQVRLRPILMTTLAMIFGMVPLAFALSEGSEQRAPMGQAVIGGVITSSLLTLVVVPVVYCYLDDLAVWAKRKWAGTKAPRDETPVAADGRL
jgi:hydrophobic/amphiphilic exporter-1 (mainly G- bacteria), HAE1 family